MKENYEFVRWSLKGHCAMTLAHEVIRDSLFGISYEALTTADR